MQPSFRKKVRAVALFIIFQTSSAFCYSEKIKLYNWSYYLSREVIAKFEKETGHTITQKYYDDEDVRDRAITSGRADAYDLILTSDVSANILWEQGIFQDLSSVDSSNHDPRWKEMCGPAGVPYTWGTMGIVYRDSVAKTKITSWSQFFSPPDEHKGHIVLHYNPVDTVAAALFASKFNPFTDNESELSAAFEQLQNQKPHLLAVAFSETYAYEKGKRHKMTMGLGYTGQINWFIQDFGQEDWRYVVPEEGTLLWTECWVAPANKGFSDGAKAFLEFLNKPEIAAINAEFIWAPTTVPAAIHLTTEEYKTDKNLFPSKEILSRSVSYQRISDLGLDLRNRMLNKLQQ